MDASSDATILGDRFRGQILLLRGRAGLTQRALAAHLGISEQAIRKWEGGEGYPSPARLQALIALYLERGVFTASHEAAEAMALWEALRREAARHTPPFDTAWFAQLRPAVPEVPGGPPPDPAGLRAAAPETPVSFLPPPAGASAASPGRTQWQSWGEAPTVTEFQGRQAESAALRRWLVDERCRLVLLLGLGGIGKTALVTHTAHALAPHFTGLCWRSLRNAPPPEEWLAEAIGALAPLPPVLPPGLPERLALLLAVLRERRCLLVLDNLETVLEPGAVARYRAGYEGYGEVLRQVGQSEHQSAMLLTGREAPPELALMAGVAPLRALHLGALDLTACRALLQDKGLTGDDDAWQGLVSRYGGNPLALILVGQTIATLFGGAIEALLAYAVETVGAVFGGIRRLLEEQVARLSPLEQSLVYWLGVEREPVGVAALRADLAPGAGPGEVLEALQALSRRSLLERGAERATYTLQPVVLEYVSERLVAALAQEVIDGRPALLVSHAVVQATSKDYVRRSQERLIARPILGRLVAACGGAEGAERRLVELLRGWRDRPQAVQGYGPGSVVNLLRLLRGDLRGLDLSRLAIRQTYLQGVEAQDVSLAGAHLADAVLAEAFDYSTAVALSADGAFLASGTPTGAVRLWRTANRALQLAMQGHAGGVRCIALSGDGRLLASGGVDGTVKLWAAEGRQFVATLQGHTGEVWGVALSEDGRLVASGSWDGTVRLWEAESRRLLATLQGHTAPVMGVALSRDGRLLASGGYDRTVRLWEAGTGHLLATLQGHTGLVRSVALSADGRLVASCGDDGTVRLWEAGSGYPLATLPGHAGAVYGVALSGDGQLVASGSWDGAVKLWEAGSGRLLATLQGHTGVVWGVALSGDGRLVASGSWDGSVKLWEAGSRQLLATLQGHTGVVYGVALSGDGQLVASGSWDGAVKLWDAGSGRLLATLRGHTGLVRGVALSRDGRLVASGSWDGAVKLWEAGSGRLLATLQGHTGGIYGVALSGDGRLLASGGDDGTVRLWEAESGRPLATLQGHTGVVWGVALSGDRRLLASGGDDGTVRLWEAESGRPLATLQGHTGVVRGVALSEDGRLVASGGVDGTVRLWESGSGQLLATLQGHTGVVYGVGMHRDGRLVASSSWDGTVRLWEAGSGRLLATLHGHTGGVRGVALSGDGQLVASGGEDGIVRLWEAGSGACLRTLRSDRRYERMDITGLTGINEAQHAALQALGALDGETALGSATALAQVSSPQATSTRPSAPPSESRPLPLAPDRPSTNIRAPRTTFVGRAKDLAALTQALDPATHSDARLFTLTGVAGSGKTRLALAVAEALCDAYQDGIWLVDLSPLPASAGVDVTPVVAATLAALDLHEQAGQAALNTLIAALRAQSLLLVLDNCEHVVTASAALTERLLATCPELRILATSQQALGHGGETVWPVAPLAVPPQSTDAANAEEVQLLEQSDAIQLFLQRAQAAQPGFALSTGTAASVVAICRRLDGLPLAIELAAARLNVLPVDDLLTRLEDRFRVLRRGGRAAPDRHQALQAAMDWSYGLLDSAEQTVLRRLAVFSGGWDLAAAEAICADVNVAADRPGLVAAGGPRARGSLDRPREEHVAAEAVLELLDELLARSLVYVYEAGDVPRYGMLETVRQYGLQQTERAGEAAVVRDRHLSWCLALAEQAAPALQGPEQATWLARLGREHDNLRTALQWALDRGKAALGLRLACELWMFWRRRGHLREGRHWLASLLALEADRPEVATSALRATGLECAAWLAEDEHEFAQASALFAESGVLRRAQGGEERSTAQLINAAMEARAGGDYARATALLEQSLAQHRALGNREGIIVGGLGLSLSRLGLVLAEQGEYERAVTLYEECLALVREIGDREGIGIALLGLGDIARDQADTPRVVAYCEETLALFRELGQTWAIGFSLNNLALAAYREGDLALAASRAQESELLFRELQAGPSLAEVLVTAGRIRGAQGETAAAQANLAEALTLAWAKGPRLVVAAALEALGMEAVRSGQAPHGVQLLGAAARLRQAMGAPTRPADRSTLEGAQTAARLALGHAAYAEAWGAGESLPLEQILLQAGTIV